MTRALLFWGAIAATPMTLAAQGDCYPDKRSNEAATFAIISVPLAYGPGGAWHAQPGVRWTAGLELTVIPAVPPQTATPTTCRPGKGPENTDLLPVLPRPRVTVALPGRIFVDASWVPPIRVRGVRANLLGLALGRRFAVGPSTGVTVRGHTTLGEVRAPITCNDDAVQDSESECFEGTVSDDAYRPNIYGIDLTADHPVTHKVSAYLGAGYNRLQPRFQVNFTNSIGDRDRRRVIVDLDRVVMYGGGTWQPVPRLSASTEIYVSPEDAMTVRLLVRRTF